MKKNKIPKYAKEVVNPYNIKENKNRKGITIDGPWKDVIKTYIVENKIKALYLNISTGWCDLDYNFLADLETIEELVIIASKAKNISSIEKIVNLSELSITCSTQDEIDFTKLNNLKKCYLYWWKGAYSIFGVSSLESLYLDNIKIEDYSLISNLLNLRSLTIANSSICSIKSISGIENLEELNLLNSKKVIDFSPISKLTKLKKLTIDGSKLLNCIDFLKRLKNIEILNISNNGEIASLEPIKGLSNLKALSFIGNSNIKDGNLGVLELLPNLAMLMFAQRRHYSHRLIKEWDWNNFDKPDILLEKR